MVVWGDAAAEQEGLQRWFEKLCMADDTNNDEEETAPQPQPTANLQLTAGSSRDEERLVDLRRHLANLTSQRQEVSTALDLAESRVKLLQLVDDRLGVLPPVVVEDAAPSTSKKSKSKGGSKKEAGGAELKTQPRCGYDERLSWDDERFSAWMASDEGREMLSGSKDLDGRLVDADGADVVLANGDATAEAASSSSTATAKVCGVAKRKCKRHAEWNVVRTDDFEVEKDSQVSSTAARSGDDEMLTLRTHPQPSRRLRPSPRSQKTSHAPTPKSLTSRPCSRQSGRHKTRGRTAPSMAPTAAWPSDELAHRRKRSNTIVISYHVSRTTSPGLRCGALLLRWGALPCGQHMRLERNGSCLRLAVNTCLAVAQRS